jgi:FG-GAP-like repeat/Fibronectin type III domain
MLPKHLKLSLSVTSLLLFLVLMSHAVAGQAQFAWDAPANSDGTPVADLAGYYLYWQDSTGVLQRVDVGNQTTYTLTNLPGGMTYTVDVTAYDTAGNESDPSNTVTVTVPLTTATDLDGDGKADLVWRNTATGDVAIWLMDGLTLKQGKVIAARKNLAWQIVELGDVDGDGKADLVWRNTTTGDLVFWLMDGLTLKQGQGIAWGKDLAWQIQ